MDNIRLKDIEPLLQTDLARQLVGGRFILDRFCVIDEDSRRSPAYVDPNYAGFYYHLGKYIQPRFLLEIGFDLGLLSASFLVSCKSVKKFVGFRGVSKIFVSPRLGHKNVSKVMKGEKVFHIGELFDSVFETLIYGVDAAIITEESSYDRHLEYLDFIWPSLRENGIIVCEYLDKNKPAMDAYRAFCESKNREPMLFATRYGTGLVQK
jgi:hypothetical protein